MESKSAAKLSIQSFRAIALRLTTNAHVPFVRFSLCSTKCLLSKNKISTELTQIM